MKTLFYTGQIRITHFTDSHDVYGIWQDDIVLAVVYSLDDVYDYLIARL